jgi:hypothetical protein
MYHQRPLIVIIWLYGSAGSALPVHEALNYGFMALQLAPALWLFGSIALWLYGSMALWLYAGSALCLVYRLYGSIIWAVANTTHCKLWTDGNRCVCVYVNDITTTNQPT